MRNIIFECCVGVNKPTRHESEKFLVYLLDGDTWVPLNTARQKGMVVMREEGSMVYATDKKIFKIVVDHKGFKIPHKEIVLHAEYRDDLDLVTIKSCGPSKDFFFRSSVRFLNNAEVLKIVPKGTHSWNYARKYVLPSRETLKKMISKSKNPKRGGKVRKILR